jgi:hypothetical protein
MRSSILRLRDRARAVLAGCVLAGAAASAHAVNELDVKAALMANLLAFAEWPGPAAPPAGAPLVLCVGADQPLRAPLATLQGRLIRQWQLNIHVLLPTEAVARCHALLVDNALLAARPALKQELRTLPLLSFADDGHAPEAPIGIRLDVGNGRVVFTVDLGAARNNGMSLSSRLLRLAREVRE